MTTRGRVTIPKEIREKANLSPGDVVAFEVDGDSLVACRVTNRCGGYFRSLGETLDEWLSPEDEDAWRDL